MATKTNETGGQLLPSNMDLFAAIMHKAVALAMQCSYRFSTNKEGKTMCFIVIKDHRQL